MMCNPKGQAKFNPWKAIIDDILSMITSIIDCTLAGTVFILVFLWLLMVYFLSQAELKYIFHKSWPQKDEAAVVHNLINDKAEELYRKEVQANYAK